MASPSKNPIGEGASEMDMQMIELAGKIDKKHASVASQALQKEELTEKLEQHEKELIALTEEAESLRTKAANINAKLQDQKLSKCVVCDNSDSSVVYLPCGHYIHCEECKTKHCDCGIPTTGYLTNISPYRD